MNTKSRYILVARTLTLSGMMFGCDADSSNHAATDGHDHGAERGVAPPVATNRVDIPASVRQNLGITFVKVEARKVAQTLRVPGHFELLPTARREYRTPLAGRVELLVNQFQAVDSGTPLYRLEAAAWWDLHEQIASVQATIDSMGPLREAHRRHEQSLADKVTLWKERLEQLEQLRLAGGGSASQFTEARATLNATEAELAEVMERDAELQAQQGQAEAALRSLSSRRDLLISGSRCGDGYEGVELADGLVVCAGAAGIVETIGITPGGLAEENGNIMTIVKPDQIRFRAKGLQSDLGRLRDGLAARIAAPMGGSLSLQDAMMSGKLQIGLSADADERTVDLIVVPAALSSWARNGVAAYLEVTLAGGEEELAIPMSAVVRDGASPIIFRRDPADREKVIRMEADIGMSDGRWIVIKSGIKEGDEIVLGGNYQLMLATSGSASEGGHFHPDGTFHAGEDE